MDSSTSMEPQPFTPLAAWAQYNGVTLNNVRIVDFDASEPSSSEDARGYGIAATHDAELEDNASLVVVPKELILSAVAVEDYAKSDANLRELLGATSDLSTTDRGAILLYLLHQLLHLHREANDASPIAVSGPWTQYIPLLRPVTLPSTWPASALIFLAGTSLHSAVRAKQASLASEIEHVRTAAAEKLPWLHRALDGDDDSGKGAFDLPTAWHNLDSWYRSRGFALPGHGDAALVPVLDMVNHAEGAGTSARYCEGADGDVHLLLKPGKKLVRGGEVFISYGDEKSAAEMLFSYGFIEGSMARTQEMKIECKVPADDPLKRAKEFLCGDGMVKLTLSVPKRMLDWDGEILWLACVNEEDGLEFKVLQLNDGTRELRVFWQEEEVPTAAMLEQRIRRDPQRKAVFELRAVCVLQQRVREQLEVIQQPVGFEGHGDLEPEIVQQAKRLRELETGFLKEADQSLEEQKDRLAKSEAVMRYLGLQDDGDREEDFT